MSAHGQKHVGKDSRLYEKWQPGNSLATGVRQGKRRVDAKPVEPTRHKTAPAGGLKMTTTTEIPEYEVELTPEKSARDEKWDREDLAFRIQFPTLLQNYPEEYVAIHEGRVVAHGRDQDVVAMQAYRENGYVAILVRKVTLDPPRIVRIPSFRKL